MNPDNACILRITAAAGTELADAYSCSTVNSVHVRKVLPAEKQFTTRRAVILHAAWLRQSFLHCAIFLTAASRRSLGRISVPVWPITLSGRLLIVALVGFYPTNKLIRRGTILRCIAALIGRPCDLPMLCGIRPPFESLSPTEGQVSHVLLTRLPLYSFPEGNFLARLACMRHAASVRSEPGSNSPKNIKNIILV